MASSAPKRAAVDTNVMIVANGKDHESGPACILASSRKLRELQNDAVLLLDTEGEILKEYKNHMSYAGQPGIGDAFFKWLHDNQAVQGKVEKINVTKTGNLFNIVSARESLQGFDPSDHKFLAVAMTCKDHVDIYNATDSDWQEYSEAIEEIENIAVVELCGGT